MLEVIRLARSGKKYAQVSTFDTKLWRYGIAILEKCLGKHHRQRKQV